METEARVEDGKALSALLGLVAFVVLLTFATGALAGLISKDANGNWARLNKGPCTNKVILGHIPEQYRNRFSVGEAQLDGKLHPLCWVLAPDASVILVYEDGETGKLPAHYFKPESDS